MRNAALRRAAAGSILTLACLGTAGPAATAAPAPASHTTSVSSAATAGSLTFSYDDCRRAAASTTSMRLKMMYALADPGCRQTMARWAPILIQDGGALVARICAGSQQPGGFIYRWIVFNLTGGAAMVCSP